MLNYDQNGRGPSPHAGAFTMTKTWICCEIVRLQFEQYNTNNKLTHINTQFGFQMWLIDTSLVISFFFLPVFEELIVHVFTVRLIMHFLMGIKRIYHW